MLPEISNHDDEGNEIVEYVNCHRHEPIGCGIGGDEGGGGGVEAIKSRQCSVVESRCTQSVCIHRD